MPSGTPCPFACFLRVLRLRAVIPLCTAHPLKKQVTLIHYRFTNSQKPAVGDGKIDCWP